ncbi:hypothetical protein LB504_004304 [Fusarium proliferatum]|nr:hypothetical protein LB504_004304 [Fusarium proliferatum]
MQHFNTLTADTIPYSQLESVWGVLWEWISKEPLNLPRCKPQSGRERKSIGKRKENQPRGYKKHFQKVIIMVPSSYSAMAKGQRRQT